MDLASAINDLKTSIAADGFTADLVAEIAGDYELNPKLLARKFEESTGKPVDLWVAPKPAPERDPASLKAAATAWYNEAFRGTGAEIGTTFKRDGRAGVVVAICTNTVYYIDATTERRMQLTFRNGRGRAAWVARNLEI